MDEEEEKALLRELGLSSANEIYNDEKSVSSSRHVHPAIPLGLGVFGIVNVAFLLSLPPVLRGKGAPFLPSFRKNIDLMFSQLRADPRFAQRIQRGNKLQFVDLGSGDGRIVFHAANEKLFHMSVGYEINPLLHIFASAKRFLKGPQTWRATNFYLRDIWKVELKDVDVVAVYGLAPIMKDLGIKLQAELKPGSFVLSNVFSIPGWKPTYRREGTIVYRTPDCWLNKETTALSDSDHK